MHRRLLVFVLFAVVALASDESNSTTSNDTSTTTNNTSTSSTTVTEETPSCPVNEEWDICGELCEPTCWNCNPKYCARIECTIYTAGCRCQLGYVRNELNECVRPDRCPRGCNKKN